MRLSMMAAVWLTVLLVHATRRDTAWLWLSYGIVLASSILLDVYLALLLLAHVAFLCLYRHSRTVLVRFAVASVLAGCAVAPFVSRGHRPSASDRLDRTDRPPHDRRCGGSTVFRTKPAVHDRVGTCRSDGCCLVALHVRAPGAGRSTANDAGDRMACDTDRGDPHLVGGGSTRSTRLATCVSPRRRWRWFWASASAHWPSQPWMAAAIRERFRSRCRSELFSGAAWSVRQIRNGLQPSGRSDHREGCAG